MGLRSLLGIIRVLGWEFTRLCTYLGALFFIPIWSTSQAPSLPPSETGMTLPYDYLVVLPSPADTRASLSDQREFQAMDPTQLSSFGACTAAQTESFTTPASNFFESVVPLPVTLTSPHQSMGSTPSTSYIPAPTDDPPL